MLAYEDRPGKHSLELSVETYVDVNSGFYVLQSYIVAV